MTDPKQFLLMHVEKFVLAVMAVLLVLVLAVYQPWGVEVRQRGDVKNLLKQGLDKMYNDNKTPPPQLMVPDYVYEIDELYLRPWKDESSAPALLSEKQLMFWNTPKKGVWRVRAPDAPPVVPVKAVYAKSDRGQVIVVFQVDDVAERRALEGTIIQDYQGGLPYERIEIYRVDRNTGESTRITPDGWVPQGLPIRYGAPADLGGASLFSVPTYIYAPARPTGPGPGGDDAMRRRRQEEMARRMQEDMRRPMEEDQRRRAEEEKARGDASKPRTTPTTPRTTPRTTPTPTPTPPRTTPRTTPAPTPRTTPKSIMAAPSGWYYFVDQSVDPEGRYEYNVVIVCRNPVYEQYKDSREGVKEFVSSNPISTPASDVFKVDDYKKWFFQGGTHSDQVELGTFKVRCFIGGRREMTPEEIGLIVAELSGADVSKIKGKTPGKTAEPEGTWVEQNFTVRPGEEVGGKASVMVGGEKREVDFSTGCFVVSVQNDVQVVEDARTVAVPGKDGAVRNEQRINRMVFPKLRLAYMDKRGTLKSKWQEVAPPLPKGTEKTN